MLPQLLVSALAASAASAASVGKTNTCSLIRQNVNFDDQTYPALLPSLTPLTTYKGIQYSGLSGVRTLLTGDTSGANLNLVNAPSPPNVVVTGFAASIKGHEISLTTHYPAATRPYFNLHDLSLACFANTVLSQANVPIDCDITFKSYRNGALKGTKQVQYKSDLKLTLDPITGKLPVGLPVGSLPIGGGSLPPITKLGSATGNLKTRDIPIVSATYTRFHLPEGTFCDVDKVVIHIDSGTLPLGVTVGTVLNTVGGALNDPVGSVTGVFGQVGGKVGETLGQIGAPGGVASVVGAITGGATPAGPNGLKSVPVAKPLGLSAAGTTSGLGARSIPALLQLLPNADLTPLTAAAFDNFNMTLHC